MIHLLNEHSVNNSEKDDYRWQLKEKDCFSYLFNKIMGYKFWPSKPTYLFLYLGLPGLKNFLPISKLFKPNIYSSKKTMSLKNKE